MKTIKVTKTEKEILDAVKSAQAQGVKIIRSDWSIEWNDSADRFESIKNCSCPLGAVLLAKQPQPTTSELARLADDNSDGDVLAQIAARVLDKPESWATGFVSSYDSDPEDDVVEGRNSANKAGIKVRQLIFKK